MKVLVISHMFPRRSDDWDGIFVHEQVVALRKTGIDARVIVGNPEGFEVGFNINTWRHLRCPRNSGALPEWQELQGVPVMYFTYSAPYFEYWKRFGAACYVREIRQLAHLIRGSFPYDLVHAHTAWLDGSGAVWLARYSRVPMLLTEHTGPFSTLTALPVMRWVTQHAINRADAVIAVSEALKRDILRQVKVKRPDKIEVIGNGMRPDLFHPTNEMPPEDGTIRALWVGGYYPVKQPFRLIQAFSVAWQHDPRLRLSMVGAGPLEREVREYVRSEHLEKVISFYPTAPRQLVASYLRRHHFLVVSSETETFSIIVIEALACGRPVLSTRCGGPEDTIRDKSVGELVESSREGLTEGFLTMVNRLRDFDPQCLYAYTRDNYSVDVIASRVAKIYVKICAGMMEHDGLPSKASQVSL